MTIITTTSPTAATTISTTTATNNTTYCKLYRYVFVMQIFYLNVVPLSKKGDEPFCLFLDTVKIRSNDILFFFKDVATLMNLLL